MIHCALIITMQYSRGPPARPQASTSPDFTRHMHTTPSYISSTSYTATLSMTKSSYILTFSKDCFVVLLRIIIPTIHFTTHQHLFPLSLFFSIDLFQESLTNQCFYICTWQVMNCSFLQIDGCTTFRHDCSQFCRKDSDLDKILFWW